MSSPYVNYMNIDLKKDNLDWWQRDSNGTLIEEGGWEVPCPNGPIREYMSDIVRDNGKYMRLRDSF